MMYTDRIQKNIETYQKLGSHYVKSLQALMDTGLAQTKTVQARSQDMFKTVLDSQYDVARSSLKTFDNELKTWSNVWGEVVSLQGSEVSKK